MSYSMQTDNLKLPIYEEQDKPTYLGDWNETMETIDVGYGSVKTIEQNVDALEISIGNVVTSVNKCEEDINVNTASISENTAAIANNKTSIDDNKNEIDKLKLSLDPKKWKVVLIGDSYMDNHGLPRASLAATFARLYPDVTWYNYSDSGSGFGLGGLRGRNFAQQVANAAADLTSNNVPLDSITHVFVVGGRNDAGAQDGSELINRSTLIEKVNDCLGATATSFPEAKAVMFPCLYDWKLPRIALLSVEAVVREASQKAGVWCARNAWSLGIGEMGRLYIGGNDIHPNETGCELMCRSMITAIVNNDPNMMRCQFAHSGSYRFYLYESGIEVRGLSTVSGNTVVPRSELPSFIKVGVSESDDWYQDGSTFPVKYQFNTYGVVNQNSATMTPVYFNSNGLSCATSGVTVRMSFLIPIGF